MRINGVWVGWGLGDWSHNPDGSDGDPTVRNAKAFMRRMYRSYAGNLADTNKFDQQMYDVVCIMQDKLVQSVGLNRLYVGQFIRGVLDLPTEIAMGFKKANPVLPIEFTVEGHGSNLFFGPAASNAQILEAQQVCHAKPVFYDCTSLPFNNRSGVEALVSMFLSNQIEGPLDQAGRPIMWPFPVGAPWSIIGFSQGAMVISEFMEREVLAVNGRCHHRLASFKRGLGVGNPRRERGKMAPWNDNPPPPDTGGIMDHLFVTTGTVIEDRWQENANNGDMFAVNGTDRASKDKTAIAKIVTENAWGSPAGIFARALAIFGNVPAESLGLIKAMIQTIMFFASNPNPHYTTVAESGDIEWMRRVA
jgi:hypothetical protein